MNFNPRPQYSSKDMLIAIGLTSVIMFVITFSITFGSTYFASKEPPEDPDLADIITKLRKNNNISAHHSDLVKIHISILDVHSLDIGDETVGQKNEWSHRIFNNSNFNFNKLDTDFYAMRFHDVVNLPLMFQKLKLNRRQITLLAKNRIAVDNDCSNVTMEIQTKFLIKHSKIKNYTGNIGFTLVDQTTENKLESCSYPPHVEQEIIFANCQCRKEEEMVLIMKEFQVSIGFDVVTLSKTFQFNKYFTDTIQAFDILYFVDDLTQLANAELVINCG